MSNRLEKLEGATAKHLSHEMWVKILNLDEKLQDAAIKKYRDQGYTTDPRIYELG